MAETDRIALLEKMNGAQHSLRSAWNAVSGEGFSLTQAFVLFTVAKKPGIRLTALAQEIHEYVQSVSFAVGALEKQGLVTRTRHTVKNVEVRVTPAGRKAAHAQEALLRDLTYLWWGDLPEADLAAVDRAVTQLLERTR